MVKSEQTIRETQDALGKEKHKSDKLTAQVKELKIKLTNLEQKSKTEIEKLTADRDDLNKQLVKIQSKETQYKHELRQKDLTNSKL